MNSAQLTATAREAAMVARKYMAEDTDHGSFCVVPNRTVIALCEVIEALTADPQRTVLPVKVSSLYHEVLMFGDHVSARKEATRVGDESEADKQGHEAGEAWRRLQEALGVK